MGNRLWGAFCGGETVTALPAGLGGELYHTTGDGIFSLLLQIQGSGKA